MAMAAARLAARRLTSQTPQAILRSAVSKELGLLNRGGSPAHALRRFTSSAKEPMAKVSAEHPSLSRDSRLMAADRKKEELADLLHEIQMNNEIPRARRMKDRRLLQRLTEHVVPRPTNPEWRSYVLEQTVNRCLRGTATCFAFLFVVENWRSLVDRYKKVQGAHNESQASSSCAE